MKMLRTSFIKTFEVLQEQQNLMMTKELYRAVMGSMVSVTQCSVKVKLTSGFVYNSLSNS